MKVELFRQRSSAIGESIREDRLPHLVIGEALGCDFDGAPKTRINFGGGSGRIPGAHHASDH